MIVLLKINGRLQLDEIFELEMLEDGIVKLHTLSNLLDIVISDMNANDVNYITYELFHNGKADLTRFTAEYADEECEIEYELRD